MEKDSQVKMLAQNLVTIIDNTPIDKPRVASMQSVLKDIEILQEFMLVTAGVRVGKSEAYHLLTQMSAGDKKEPQ